MYRFGLTIPTEAFYDDDTRLYLHYYNNTDAVDRLSPAIITALRNDKIRDLIGNVDLSAPKAGAAEGTVYFLAVDTEEVVPEVISPDAIVPKTELELLLDDEQPAEQTEEKPKQRAPRNKP